MGRGFFSGGVQERATTAATRNALLPTAPTAKHREAVRDEYQTRDPTSRKPGVYMNSNKRLKFADRE